MMMIMIMVMMMKLMMAKICEYLQYLDYFTHIIKKERPAGKKTWLNIKDIPSKETLLVTTIVLLKQRVNGMELNY